jgi:DNA-directed RNA polymerase subunit RPC12/RpoP
MPRQIKETRCTCQSCGNVYHYGKSEEIENCGNAMQNCGKSMSCCTGCGPAVLVKDQPVKDLSKCPKCGSRAIKKEIVTHTV